MGASGNRVSLMGVGRGVHVQSNPMQTVKNEPKN